MVLLWHTKLDTPYHDPPKRLYRSEKAIDTFQPAATLEEMVKQGEGVGIKSDPEPNVDIHALKWSLIFGIKGVAAYADQPGYWGRKTTLSMHLSTRAWPPP